MADGCLFTMRGRIRRALQVACVAIPVLGCAGPFPAHGTIAPVKVFGASSVPSPVISTLQRMSDAYTQGDLGAVRRLFSPSSSADETVKRLQGWKTAGVNPLHITAISTARLGRGLFEVTTTFGSDPRVPNAFAYFVFRVSKSGATIVGADTGLHGTSYKQADWEMTRTLHFIVYHSPFTLAGSDARTLRDLENQRALFSRKFGVKLPPLASVYLYPTVELMRQLTDGNCGSQHEIGCTEPFVTPPTIQTIHAALFHEAIHVYQLSLVPPSPDRGRTFYVAPLFITEGSAVAMEEPQIDPKLSDYCSDLTFSPLAQCAEFAAHRVHPLQILSDKGFKRVDASYAYSLGGSFVSYLLQQFGYRRFGVFYRRLAGRPSDRMSDYDVASQSVYHRTTRRLLQSWLDHLCNGQCSP